MNSTRKSILIVTQIFDVGGLETYIAGQVKSLLQDGWEVHLVCGSEYKKKFLPEGLKSFTPNLKFGVETSFEELIQTVKQLSDLIERKDIQYMHAHPFTSLFPSFLAAKIANIPFIVTLHGPASLNSYFGYISDFLLKGIILPQSELVLSVSQETYNLAGSYCRKDNLIIQPNVVNLNLFHPSSEKTKKGKWLIVSRLDEFKIVGIFEFIKLAQCSGISEISIAGDGSAKDLLLARLTESNLLENVQFLGVRNDISTLIHDFEGLAGMGRVFLEGVACNKNVCLIGYDGVKGFLSEELFLKAAQFNFSGRNISNLSVKEFQEGLSHSKTFDFETTIRLLNEQFNEEKIWSRFAMTLFNLQVRAGDIAADLFSFLTFNFQNNQAPYLYSFEFLSNLGKLLNGVKHYNAQSAEQYRSYFNSFIYELNNQRFSKNEELITQFISDKNTIQTEYILKSQNLLIHEKDILQQKNEELNNKLFQSNEQNFHITEQLKIITKEKNILHDQNLLLTSTEVQLNEHIKTLKTEWELEAQKKDEIILNLNQSNNFLQEEKIGLNQKIVAIEIQLSNIVQNNKEISEKLNDEKKVLIQDLLELKNKNSELDVIINQSKEAILQKDLYIKDILNYNSELLKTQDNLARELSELNEKYIGTQEKNKKEIDEKEKRFQDLLEKYTSLTTFFKESKKTIEQLDSATVILSDQLNNNIKEKNIIIQEKTLQAAKAAQELLLIEEEYKNYMLSSSGKLKNLQEYIGRVESELATIKKSKLYKLTKLFKEDKKNQNIFHH